MLPPEAKTYFDSLSSAANADAWSVLARKQQEFERDERLRGRALAGASFAARLADLYADSLNERARAIVETLKTVHQSFNSPLDEAVDAQLQDWGASAIADAFQALEGGYVRHLQRFQIDPANASGFSHTYALAQVTVANLPRHYLWEMRNVPTKRPQPPPAGLTVPPVVNNFNSPVGAVQTGPGSTAHVQQQRINGETSELQAALVALREALERAPDVEPEARRELIVDVDGATSELQKQRPNRRKLLRSLGGIGTVAGAIGSVQPAYEAAKALARALGLPL